LFSVRLFAFLIFISVYVPDEDQVVPETRRAH